MEMPHLRQDLPDSVFRAILIAGAALAAFLALPWVLMGCRAAGMPGWVYGAEPMLGWLRMWSLLPVWLMLAAVVALVFAVVRSDALNRTTEDPAHT